MIQLKSYFKILLFSFSIGLFLFSLFIFFNTNNSYQFNKIILVNSTNEDLTYIGNSIDNIKNTESLSIPVDDNIIINVTSNNFSFFLKNSKGKIYESKDFFIDFQNENNKTTKILISKVVDNKFDFLLE